MEEALIRILFVENFYKFRNCNNTEKMTYDFVLWIKCPTVLVTKIPIEALFVEESL